VSDIRKASQDAIDAAKQGEQFAMMLAAIQAAQAAQPPAPAPVVQQKSGEAAKWLAIGVSGSMLMVTVAFAAVALAIASACIALVALVVYGIYRDIRKGSK
jgi:Na+/proline symporter